MGTSSTRSDRIHCLAVFLREHGDAVLNGTRRLTLTTSCLNELNYIFRQLLDGQENDSFDVPFGCGGSSDFIHDVLFLHDFMQKTGSLKIVQSSQTIQGSLDLSKFHGLKILELKRVPPHLLVGLDSLVLQLETLICQRNISSLKEILRSRNKVPQPWLNVKMANFSYNTLTSLDDNLSLLPKLQCLDCSNNSISGATGVQCLHNIKILNLSFNFLEHVNIFHERARGSLTVLYLRNNCIESTQGLEGLRQLRELDLAYNCLAGGDSLAALKQLPGLTMLKLEGNPISFHKDYTAIVVSQLNWRAQTAGFKLDSRSLPSKLIEPKALRLRQARKSNMPAPEPVVSVPTLQPLLPSELVVPGQQAVEQCALPGVSVHGASPSNAPEVQLHSLSEQEGSSCSSLDALDSLTPRRPRPERKSRRRRSTRVAAILDEENRQSPVKASTTVQQDILDYKSELESRKQQLGDEWLIGVSRLRLPDAESTPCGTPDTRTTVEPNCSAAWQGEKGSNSGAAESSQQSLAAVGAAEGSLKDPSAQRRISQLSQGVVVLDDVPPDNLMDSSGTGGFSWTSTATGGFAADEADAEDDLGTKLFLAQRTADGSKTAVFVGIRDDAMKESDSLTGKTLVCLNLNQLSSAALSDDTVVKLKFDTDIPSKKEKCYIFESCEDAEEVMQMVQPFVEAKVLKDLYIEALQCVKCGARFPKHAADKVVVRKTEGGVMKDVQESDRCPRCGGDILLAVDVPDDKSLMSSSAKTGTDLESAQSCLNESAYESAASETMAEVACQDNVSEESIETVTPEQQGGLFRPGFRKSSSEITVLSNPSQSSIMVISSSSGNNVATDIPHEGEKTLSPPSTVVLPTLKEIVEEPMVGITRTESLSICQKTRAANSSDTFLSEASFKSALSRVSHGSEAASSSSHEMASLWELFDDREEILPESFSCIDHRVRLFLEVSVFAQEEIFLCFLEVDLVTSSIPEETAVLFVVSNKKCYFFKKMGNDREDPKSWLQLLESRPLDGLKLISLLLGSQGFRLSWLAEKAGVPWHTCLVRDADRCNCFLEHFTGSLQRRMPSPPLVEMDVSESLAQLVREVIGHPEGQHSPLDFGEDEVVLYVLGFWDRDTDTAASAHPKSVALVVTRSDIHISRVHYLKTPKGSVKYGLVRYEPLIHQKISNLTAVHLHKDAKTAKLTFLDEDKGTETAWTATMETKASLHSLLNSLRTPWEELFGIEMPLAPLAH